MAKLRQQMLELRHLRNVSKGLLRDDVAFLKGERGGKKVGPRLMEKVSTSARDAASNAAGKAGEHKVKIGTGVALGVAAFTAWIFRDRIEQVFDRALDYLSDDNPAPATIDKPTDQSE